MEKNNWLKRLHSHGLGFYPQSGWGELQFKEGDQVCLVMEYIQGQDLTHANRLTEKEALRYIRQIGSALMVVHENNLVHRDVRPANIIMRQGKREAVLIDFGLAVGFDHPLTTINPTTADGFTPLELYHVDAERGAYTDVYSLAATLYQLLTGEKPPSVRDRSLARAKLKPPQDVNPQMSDRTIYRTICSGLTQLKLWNRFDV
ncbi:serine/threonine protein kinase [Coleofasciculus sp. E2-BRE-01]|uniref:serine/threonine protein kinase n=1 Tax=Coleofasciculus sp. E2-BRE-01 TaxID=3069524 RepID=UPI0032F9916D